MNVRFGFPIILPNSSELLCASVWVSSRLRMPNERERLTWNNKEMDSSTPFGNTNVVLNELVRRAAAHSVINFVSTEEPQFFQGVYTYPLEGPSGGLLLALCSRYLLPTSSDDCDTLDILLTGGVNSESISRTEPLLTPQQLKAKGAYAVANNAALVLLPADYDLLDYESGKGSPRLAQLPSTLDEIRQALEAVSGGRAFSFSLRKSSSADWCWQLADVFELQSIVPARRLEGLNRNNLPGWKGQNVQALIGRDTELAQLTDAFHDPSCSTVCVIAGGGYGKSSLVTSWMESIRDDPEPGAFLDVRAGFAYSFYKQGWEGHSAVSSTPFFEECLSSLTGKEPDQLPRHSIERWSHDILNVVSQVPSLLLLDGLEPHQSPLGAEAEGEILDKTLKDFVKSITMPAGGLCVITSRIMPPELMGPPMESGRVRVIKLQALDFDARVRVLKAAGVRSDHPDLDYWAGESQGHPLLLALLAPRIESGYDPTLFETHRVLESIPKTIRNVVFSHLDHLGPCAEAVLLAASMFDHAVPCAELRRLLLDKKIIPRVTAPLYKRSRYLHRRVFSERAFVRGVELLEKAAMITRLGPAQDPNSWILELHPIVQNGVRTELIANDTKTWRNANWTIYKSLVQSVKAKRPDTKEQLKHLYAAVPHGVNAGRGLSAGWMYARRCLRNYRAYSTTFHGMIADDISALSHYFDGNWRTLKEDIGLNQFAQSQAYVWSGTLLTAVNRWTEGRSLLQRGLDVAVTTQNFTTASRTARHLGVGFAIAGDLKQAERYARESIEVLERRQSLINRVYDLRLVKTSFHRMASRATLGNVLHYQGRLDEAEQAFRDAAVHLKRATGFPTLRGEWCFRAVELMLDQGKFDEADLLVQHALESPEEPKGWSDEAGGGFALPMLRLAFVRNRVRCADVRGTVRDWDTVKDYADTFVRIGEDNQLRMDWLVPLFKIALSSIARLSDDAQAALWPLEEAEKRVMRSGNRLFEVDLRIEQASVHLAMEDRGRGTERIRQAETLAEEMGYGCRRAEIARISSLCGLE